MPNKEAIIIGAGISGLSAGCYLQMNGYDTQILSCTPFREGCALPGRKVAIPLTAVSIPWAVSIQDIRCTITGMSSLT